MNVRRAVCVGAAVAAVLSLGGCAIVGGGRPSFESERVRVAAVVDEIKDALPQELILEVEIDEGVTNCGGGDLITGGGDGTQVSAYRRVVVAPELDARRWMDALADEYEAKPGWKVNRSRENETFPGEMSDTFWAPEGNSINVSLTPGKMTDIGFNAREDAVGEPSQRFEISASAECADKPSNWDVWGDFLTENPLPSPLPTPPAG